MDSEILVSDGADPAVSQPAQEFARRITPRLIEQLTARKASLLARVTNRVIRTALKFVWGTLLELTPEGVEIGTQAGLDEFGTMSVTEIFSLILAHNAARGIASHPSLSQFAPRGIPMSADHEQALWELHPEIVAFAKEGLARKSAARVATSPDGHAIAAAGFVNPLTVGLLEKAAWTVLELAAQTAGPALVAGTLAWKNQIRAVAGPALLQMLDTIIHGLKDVQVGPTS
jgi:hypothetical protein